VKMQKKTIDFLKIQVSTLRRMLLILDKHIANVDKDITYSWGRHDPSNSVLDELNVSTQKTNREFIWNSDNSNLLELMVALIQMGVISTTKAKLNRKKLITRVLEIFDLRIADIDSSISNIKQRKASSSEFILKLNHSFEEWMNK
jgi:RteC protein